MQNVQLSVDRSQIDANFEGYKVSMDEVHFDSKKLEQNVCTRIPSETMMSLQHMKLFSNDNQLFCDVTKSTESQEYFFRILDTGHIQMLVFQKQTRQWDTSIVAQIDMDSGVSGYPNAIIFTGNSLAVVGNGTSEVSVFLVVSDSNWVKMLAFKPSEEPGISLIDARVLENKLNVLVSHVEAAEDRKGTRTRIFRAVVGLDDIDFAENLTVEKVDQFVQEGHFDTCTFDSAGNVVFLSSERPVLEGAVLETPPKYTWKQERNEVKVVFELNADITEHDVNIDVTRTEIRLIVKDCTLLSGFLFAEIDENDVEICADQKNRTLTLKLKATNDATWEKLLKLEVEQKARTAEVVNSDEAAEECDEADQSLFLFWANAQNGHVYKQCDVSGSQVLFHRHTGLSSAEICLRHDVDGLLWSLEGPNPRHVATLQAFGYVQASKTTRSWSGSSPSNKFACIVERNNRILLYKQKVEVTGNLSNRKTSTTVSHVSKQHLLRIDCPDRIRGVHLTDSHLFAITNHHVHVAELPV